MKIYQYFNMFLCSLILFVFIFIISNEFGVAFIFSLISFPFFIILKKKIIYHDVKVEMQNIKKYFDDEDKNNS